MDSLSKDVRFPGTCESLITQLRLQLPADQLRRSERVRRLELKHEHNFIAVASDLFIAWLGLPHVIQMTDEQKADYLRWVFSEAMGATELALGLDRLLSMPVSFYYIKYNNRCDEQLLKGGGGGWPNCGFCSNNIYERKRINKSVSGLYRLCTL